MDRFDELTEPPVVGRYYFVWCVSGTWWGHQRDWPIYGPKHEDAEWLRFPQVHYHLNRFFIGNEWELEAITRPLGEFHDGIGYRANDPLPAPVLRKRRCRRAHLFPWPRVNEDGTVLLFRMKRHFAGRQCRRGQGWVCPHKGLDLGPVLPGPDGFIQCPLHGLLINAGSGIVANVPRSAPWDARPRVLDA